MNITTVKPAISIDQILNPWTREILSPQAVKLYEAVWHRMRLRKVSSVWMDDAEASVRSRMRIELIPNARAQLLNMGLLTCKEGSKQWLYTYIEQPEAEPENTKLDI